MGISARFAITNRRWGVPADSWCRTQRILQISNGSRKIQCSISSPIARAPPTLFLLSSSSSDRSARCALRKTRMELLTAASTSSSRLSAALTYFPPGRRILVPAGSCLQSTLKHNSRTTTRVSGFRYNCSVSAFLTASRIAKSLSGMTRQLRYASNLASRESRTAAGTTARSALRLEGAE